MKLWLISQTENDGYDTYDCAVVAAETEEAAQSTHPSGNNDWGEFGTWADKPANVKVELIGEAASGMWPVFGVPASTRAKCICVESTLAENERGTQADQNAVRAS